MSAASTDCGADTCKSSHCRVRLSLCRNYGEKKGQVTTAVVCKPLWTEIASTAAKKLRFNKREQKTMRLFVAPPSKQGNAGFELPRVGDLTPHLSNGTIVSVSKGENFSLKASPPKPGNRFHCAWV